MFKRFKKWLKYRRDEKKLKQAVANSLKRGTSIYKGYNLLTEYYSPYDIPE